MRRKALGPHPEDSRPCKKRERELALRTHMQEGHVGTRWEGSRLQKRPRQTPIPGDPELRVQPWGSETGVLFKLPALVVAQADPSVCTRMCVLLFMCGVFDVNLIQEGKTGYSPLLFAILLWLPICF